MKPTLRIARLLLVVSTTSILLSGCYTQLATMEDDADRYERNGAARVVDEQDSTADRAPSYYDDYDDWRGHHRLGFSYYYPSSWYWNTAFSDPYYYGWPFYGYNFGYLEGFGRNFYGYGPYYYGGYYGYSPYGYYHGYPYVVYGSTSFSQDQTRNSGYRRTGDGRLGGYSGRPSSAVGVTPASRRAGYQVPASAVPGARRAESPSSRGSSRSYAPPSSGRSSGSSAPSRSGSPSVRSAPSSGGSRSPAGGTRSSGTTRSRGTAEAPMSGYYRPYVSPQSTGSNAVAPASGYYRPSTGTQRSGSSSYAPSSGYYRADGGSQRSSAPSYTPSSSSPAPSYSPPATSAPSSGGGDGGSRSSGASRSGRN